MNSQIKGFVQKLIEEGEAVLAASYHIMYQGDYVDIEKAHQWQSRCRLLVRMLGPAAEPWKEALVSSVPNNTKEYALRVQGTLKGISQSIEEGLLARVEDLVLAEAFSELSEQAEYLFEQGYILAAGVIAGAVLEERLRRLATSNGCVPSRPRPTMADFNAELYKKQVYDKVVFKQIDALAAVRNDAAHGSSTLTKEDVQRLLTELQELLRRFSV